MTDDKGPSSQALVRSQQSFLHVLALHVVCNDDEGECARYALFVF